MSLFNIGGNTGYALGPIVVTPLVLWLGLGPGGVLACIPVLLTAVAVLGALPYLARRQQGTGTRARSGGGEDDVRAMVLLGCVIGLRSVAWFGLLTFVPLWAVSLGKSEADGQPAALADAPLRRRRDAAARARRGSLRPAADPSRRAVTARATDPRVRARRRDTRGRSPGSRRDLRGRHIRDHDRA